MATASPAHKGPPANQGMTFGPRTSLPAKLRELWSYRDLIRNLVVRDLKVRYKNSVLGVLWSLLNPLLMMLVFSVVFTFMWPNQGTAHFPVFLLAGLLPWNFFQGSVMAATASIVGHGHLIKKVYFPREVLPISVVLSNLVNFLLAMLVLFSFLIVSGIGFTPYILWLPVIILIQVAFTLGLAFLFSTLNVFYRDTLMILDVGLLAWFFLTPVFYSMEIIPSSKIVLGYEIAVHRLVRWLNPMASLIDAYRTILYGSTNGAPPGPPALDFLLRTSVTAAIVLWIGWLVFRRFSSVFGEEI